MPKMVICALFWCLKTQKMADFCGFAVVFVHGGAVFVLFLACGAGDFGGGG